MNREKHSIWRIEGKRRSARVRWFLDIETWGLNATQSGFAFGCVINEAGTVRRTFMDPMDLRGFLESQGDIIVYAHNTFRFDIWAFYSADEIRNSEKIDSNGQLIMVKFDTGSSTVEFRDSKKLIPLSIDAIGTALKLPKGILHRDFKKGTRREITEADIEYCMRDVEIMRQAVAMFERLYNEWMGGHGLEFGIPYTTASMAYRVWCANYWPEHWKRRSPKRSRSKKPEKAGTYLRDAEGNIKFREDFRGWCSSQANLDAEKSYAGGRVQVLCQPGEIIEGVRSADANSLFPSVQYDEGFPDIAYVKEHWGTPALMAILEREDLCCWADVKLKAGPDSPRFLPNRNKEGRRDYTLGTWDGWLAEPEIQHALDRGWELKQCGRIWYAPKINPFKEFVERFYTTRMRLKAAGDSREFVYKIILNAFYGRLGMKDRCERIDQPSKVAEIMERDDWYLDYELGFYDGSRGSMAYLTDREPSIKSKSTWFGFASFITSHARVRLQKAIEACGDSILYVDTDSIHFRSEALEQVKEKLEFHGHLSGWKMEQSEEIPYARYWEPKAYVMFDQDMNLSTVKHKGVSTKDDDGNWRENAGDLTKPQIHRTVTQFRTALRRDIEGGSPLTVEKRSKRWSSNE